MPPALEGALGEIGTALQALGEHRTAAAIRELRASLSDPYLRIVVLGEFNRGKSTLINALLGRVVLPARLVPTTGQITRVVFGELEECRVKLQSGHTERWPLDRLESFVLLDANGMVCEDVEYVEVAVAHDLLRQGVALIDTPGMNDQGWRPERTERAIREADLVLLVLSAWQVLTSHERALAADWLVHDLGKPVVVVLNFMNQVPESERRNVQARVDRWCREHVRQVFERRWFEVNALPALASAVRGTPAPPDDLPALRSALDTCTGHFGRCLQAYSRLREARSLLQRVSEQNVATMLAIRRDAARVVQEREARRQALHEAARRLAAEAVPRRDDLLAEAEAHLAQQCTRLMGRIAQDAASSNIERVGEWYREALDCAIMAIEQAGDRILADLARDIVRQPAPFVLGAVLRSRMRLAIESPGGGTGGSAAPWVGAGLGAVLGVALLPPAGLWIGAWVGRAAGKWVSKQSPGGVAERLRVVRQQWATHRNVLVMLAGEQYDARVLLLRRQVDEQINFLTATNTVVPDLYLELQERERLQRAVERCDLILRQG